MHMGSTHVTRCIDSTTHDYNLLDPQKRLGVFCCRECKVRQRSYSDNRDRIRLVVPEQLEHLLVRWLQRGCEQRVTLLDSLQLCCLFFRQVLRQRQEE
jgi:hypothetical protein